MGGGPSYPAQAAASGQALTPQNIYQAILQPTVQGQPIYLPPSSLPLSDPLKSLLFPAAQTSAPVSLQSLARAMGGQQGGQGGNAGGLGIGQTSDPTGGYTGIGTGFSNGSGLTGARNTGGLVGAGIGPLGRTHRWPRWATALAASAGPAMGNAA